VPLTTVQAGMLDTTAQYYSFKNRIINGAMVIDQRNAGAAQTVTTSGAYTIDRWFVQPTGASVTTQRVAGSGAFQNALRITGAASVTQCFVQQKIESLNSYDLAGQTITVTIRASSSTLTSLTCYVERATAGADNWASFATDKTQVIAINSTPTEYSFQATLSASATNGIRFIFGTGAFTSGTLDITGVQLEKGSTATSFDYRPYGTELALCQRYFETSYPQGTAVGTSLSDTLSAKSVVVVSDSKSWSGGMGFQVKKRTTPTMAFYNRSGTSGQWYFGVSGVSEASFAVITNGVSESEFAIYAVTTGQNICYGQFTASAEL